MSSMAQEEWFVRVVIIQTWLFPCCPLVCDSLMIHSSPAFVCLEPHWDFSPRMANGLHFFLPPCTVVNMWRCKNTKSLRDFSSSLIASHTPSYQTQPPLPVFDVF